MTNQTRVILSLLIFSTYLKADIVVEQPLNFGKIAISSNSFVSTTTLRRNGSQSSTDKIYVVEKGSPAILSFSNFSPFITLSIDENTPVSSSMAYPGTQQFTVTTLDIPPQVKMDSSGMGSLLFGGTLATSGLGGTYYADVPYVIYIDLEFSY